DVSVLLGIGDGTFVSSASELSVDLRNAPYRGDLDRDGTPDTVVLNDGGEILFRRGLPRTDNQFAPPVVLNPGRPAREITLLRTPTGMGVSASDTLGDTVSIYNFTGTTFTRTAVVSAGRLPQRVAAADLNGDRLDDLVIANTFDNSVAIALQQ